MECPKCGSANPTGKSYCGDCGTLLKTTDPAATELRQQVKAILASELKDQKLVEIEVTEAIVTRLTNWGRLLGYFAGIPLAILIVILGALGIKNYTDVSGVASNAQREMTATSSAAELKISKLVEDADQQAGKAKQELAELEPRIEAIKANAAAIEANTKEVQQLKSTVLDIQQRVAKPGVERWPVKTGADPDAPLVAPQEVRTTVEQLVTLDRPRELGPPTSDPAEFQKKRAGPVELKIYSVEATITAVKFEADGDYHMVLQGSSGQDMVAEIPNPDPIFTAPTSRWAREIAFARKQADGLLHLQDTRPRLPAHVRIKGVGFFDRCHGGAGAAPNCIELHPVLNLELIP